MHFTINISTFFKWKQIKKYKKKSRRNAFFSNQHFCRFLEISFHDLNISKASGYTLSNCPTNWNFKNIIFINLTNLTKVYNRTIRNFFSYVTVGFLSWGFLKSPLTLILQSCAKKLGSSTQWTTKCVKKFIPIHQTVWLMVIESLQENFNERVYDLFFV